MGEVVVSSKLQQWTFNKSSSTCSSSTTSSPDLYNDSNGTVRLDAAVNTKLGMGSEDSLSLQQRYLSSEEDLSPLEGDSSESESEDDHVSIHNPEQDCFKAKRMSIARFENGKSCDKAVLVSYVSAGRPKEINLGSPRFETTQRSASFSQLPIAATQRLRKSQTERLSMPISSSSIRSSSPALSVEPRRPSTGHDLLSPSSISLKTSDASSFTASSTRSSSPALSDRPTRPLSATAHRPQRRSSLYLTTTVPTTSFPPLTPNSPSGKHSFLSSDPYENSTTTSASPIIKSGPHKRLRSISQKLSLAKIAITPSSKKWDSRVNGRPQMPPTPATPQTPLTAPLPNSTSSSPMSRLRRNSKHSRPTSMRGPSPDAPPVPILTQSFKPSGSASRLVARGASEREPAIELPPCPNDADSLYSNNSMKTRTIRKRKSLMDLL